MQNYKHDVSPDWGLATQMVHGGLTRSQHAETAEAIYMTSGYVYQSRGRGAGGVRQFQAALRLWPLRQPDRRDVRGAHGAAGRRRSRARHRQRHGGSVRFDRLPGEGRRPGGGVRCPVRLLQLHHPEILPKWGVETEFVDGRDLSQWRKALSKPTKVVLLETPANPSLRIVDLKAVCDLGHAAGAQVIVDNVFATPLLQRPLEFGADIVVYSATKHIDGQGRCLGGVILGTDEIHQRDAAALHPPHRPQPQPGQCLDPAQRIGDAGAAPAAPVRGGGEDRQGSAGPPQAEPRVFIRRCRISRRRSWRRSR